MGARHADAAIFFDFSSTSYWRKNASTWRSVGVLPSRPKAISKTLVSPAPPGWSTITPIFDGLMGSRSMIAAHPPGMEVSTYRSSVSSNKSESRSSRRGSSLSGNCRLISSARARVAYANSRNASGLPLANAIRASTYAVSAPALFSAVRLSWVASDFL